MSNNTNSATPANASQHNSAQVYKTNSIGLSQQPVSQLSSNHGTGNLASSQQQQVVSVNRSTQRARLFQPVNDNHRRRLQALAQAQHTQQQQIHHSNDSRDASGARMKVISKKIISFNKHTSGNNDTSTTQQRLNNAYGRNNYMTNTQVASRHMAVSGEDGSVPQGSSSQPRSAPKLKLTNNMDHSAERSTGRKNGKLIITQKSVGAVNNNSSSTANNTGTAGGSSSNPRKLLMKHPHHHQLGYRRQHIMDITEDANNNSQKKLTLPTEGDNSLQDQSLQQQQQQKDSSQQNSSGGGKQQQQYSLVGMNMFYKKPNQQNGSLTDNSQSSSLKSLHHPVSTTSAKAAAAESQRSAQQNVQQALHHFQLTKKSQLMATNDSSASTSRERNLNQFFKLKKNSANNNQQDSSHQQHATEVPQIGKRRPIVLRKNNFVQTNSASKKLEQSPAQITISSNQSQDRRFKNMNKLILGSSNRDDSSGGYTAGGSLSQTRANNNNYQSLTSTFNNKGSGLPSKNDNGSGNGGSSGAIQPLNLKDTRLIKINRSKKKLDTARRSRIKQINHNTNNSNSVENLSEIGSTNQTQKILHTDTQTNQSTSVPSSFIKSKIQQISGKNLSLNKQFHGGSGRNIQEQVSSSTEQPIVTKLTSIRKTGLKRNNPNGINFKQQEALMTKTQDDLERSTLPMATTAGGLQKNQYQTEQHGISKNNSGQQLAQKPMRRGQILRKMSKKQGGDDLSSLNSKENIQITTSQQHSKVDLTKTLNSLTTKKGASLGHQLKPMHQSADRIATTESLARVEATKELTTLDALDTKAITKPSQSIPTKLIKRTQQKAAQEFKIATGQQNQAAVQQKQQQFQTQQPHQATPAKQQQQQYETTKTDSQKQIQQKNLATTSSGGALETQQQHKPVVAVMQGSKTMQGSKKMLNKLKQQQPQPQPDIINNNQNNQQQNTAIIPPESSEQRQQQTANVAVHKVAFSEESKKSANTANTQATGQNKASESRDLNTADTSNRKVTTSFQRTYCNSSVANMNRAMGTAFSFKSQNSQVVEEKPKLPCTPELALKHYIDLLTDYEKGEILDYPEVYYFGSPISQKVGGGSTKSEFNYGYDDEKGDYKIVMGDHIGYRYELIQFLGKGSFGTAVKCFDHKKKVEVAVKVIKNKKKYYYQAGVELKILQFLKDNDPDDIMNVIHLNDYVVFRKHLCISFELLSMNLFEFLKINDFNGFDHNLIRRFVIQLLYALKYLKLFQIIHCDLKPENILLKEPNKSGIKIIDFGSSAFMDERVYTYIQSRFYRAPEIMLGIPYTCAIDMWSLGCIMAELYIGYPIFPGESENDQMSRIIEMRGVPNQKVLSISERKKKFFNQETGEPIMLKNSRGKYRKPMGKPLELIIGDEDDDFTDLVRGCLEWDPEKRLTPDQALKHVWVLKGLPPQVLIHHQKMHNIRTPELPKSIQMTRQAFLNTQEGQQMRQNENIGSQGHSKPQSKHSSPQRQQKDQQPHILTPRQAMDQNSASKPSMANHKNDNNQQKYPGSTKSGNNQQKNKIQLAFNNRQGSKDDTSAPKQTNPNGMGKRKLQLKNLVVRKQD